MIYIAIVIAFVVIICAPMPKIESWLDALDRAHRIPSRERNLRAHRSWRIPITLIAWCVRRLICVVRGHSRDYAAFVPIVFCTRCRRVVEAKKVLYDA